MKRDLGLCQFDYISRLMILSLITLSGFYFSFKLTRIFFVLPPNREKSWLFARWTSRGRRGAATCTCWRPEFILRKFFEIWGSTWSTRSTTTPTWTRTASPSSMGRRNTFPPKSSHSTSITNHKALTCNLQVVNHAGDENRI